jgi:peptidoglycan/xylan/chitin deacetylase (PgdA/CDA1 family)
MPKDSLVRAVRPVPKVPVLAYHRVTENVEKYNGMAVSPAHFRRQMKFLAENNYTPITLDDWYNTVKHGTKLPEKPVIITFDDAWKSQYENALPILAEFNVPATFYVYTAVVGNNTTMSWQQLRDLARKGHSIGCHSGSHADLTKKFSFENDARYAKRLTREIQGAKDKLEEKIGVPVRHFCYPYGYYNTNVIAYLRKARFLTGTTVNPMVNTSCTPMHSLGRMIIGPATSMKALQDYLETRELRIKALLPGDGIIRNKNTVTVKALLDKDVSVALQRVKVKWNWNWKQCTWNPRTGMITCSFTEPLKPGVYSAQIHAWDSTSNHYVYAWQFRQDKTIEREPVFVSHVDRIPLSSHRRKQ